MKAGDSVILLNFSMDPPACMEDYVATIQKVTGRCRAIPSVPRSLVLGASYLADSVAGVAGISQPLNPVRVRKLYRSTWIDPMRLRELGYEWKYCLEDAFRDWQVDCPEDFAA